MNTDKLLAVVHLLDLLVFSVIVVFFSFLLIVEFGVASFIVTLSRFLVICASSLGLFLLFRAWKEKYE